MPFEMTKHEQTTGLAEFIVRLGGVNIWSTIADDGYETADPFLWGLFAEDLKDALRAGQILTGQRREERNGDWF